MLILRSWRGWLPVAVVVLLVSAPQVRAAERVDSCVECHAALPELLGAPVEGMKRDLHSEHGLSCADCHGGDPTDPDMTSMDPEKGFSGAPSKAEVPDFCARCHSDPAYMRRFNPSLPTNQRERYQTSEHGKQLAVGDEKVATCTSCHGVHGIRSGRQIDSPVYPANIPATCGSCHSKANYMAEYGLPANQERLYRRSVHGHLLLQKRDLGAPACNTCHDNHGASPPGLTSIAEICGQCHVNNAALFIASPHKSAFDRLELAECVTCHSYHDVYPATDAMLGVKNDALCGRCHKSGSAGYAAAVQMLQTIHQLKTAIDEADTDLQRAETLGVEVSDARYEFQNTHAILIQARTGIHRFSTDHVSEVAAPGLELAQRTEQIAMAALSQAYARRRNLLLPLAVIIVLIVLLAVKLRVLERNGS